MTTEQDREDTLNEMKESIINVLRTYLMMVTVNGPDPIGENLLREKITELDEYEMGE